MNDAARRLSICANLEVAVGLASIGVGLLLILAPGTAIFAAYNETIAGAFWGSDTLGAQAARMNHWLLATCGAGVVGWGISWCAVSHVPFRRGERWAWLCLLVSLLVWVLLDVVIALWFGVDGEVVFVSVALVVASAPLGVAAPIFLTQSAPINSIRINVG